MAEPTITDFANGLRDLIAATWPDVVVSQPVYEVEQIERFPWQDFAEAGSLPLAVMRISPEPDEAFSGLAGRVDRLDVTVAYAGEDAGLSTVETFRAKLELLRNALWETGLGTGQVLDWPDISTSPELPANQVFLGRNLPYYTGIVSFQALLRYDEDWQ